VERIREAHWVDSVIATPVPWNQLPPHIAVKRRMRPIARRMSPLTVPVPQHTVVTENAVPGGERHRAELPAHRARREKRAVFNKKILLSIQDPQA